MEKMTHTTYRDPSTDAERDGSTARRESLVDFERYQRPLERTHGSALHSAGVAAGLEIRVRKDTAGVRVLPGVALTPSGDHIVLAPGGQALVGPGKLVPVTTDGASVPTSGLDGSYLLTIAREETFDRRTFEDSGHKTFQTDQTPNLRLRPDGESTPEQHQNEVSLATVTLTAGKVTNLDAVTRQQYQHITLQRPVQISDGAELTVGATTAGSSWLGAKAFQYSARRPFSNERRADRADGEGTSA